MAGDMAAILQRPWLIEGIDESYGLAGWHVDLTRFRVHRRAAGHFALVLLLFGRCANEELMRHRARVSNLKSNGLTGAHRKLLRREAQRICRVDLNGATHGSSVHAAHIAPREVQR